MAKNKDSASQVYAEYTISRIPHGIRSTLNEHQLSAIRAALVAQQDEAKHSLDFRVRIPLFFRAYYFVFFGGRDRRKFVLNLEMERVNRLPRRLQRGIYLAAATLVTLAFLATFFVALYLLKSLLGFDFFSFHLSDILGVDIYGSARNFLNSWGTND